MFRPIELISPINSDGVIFPSTAFLKYWAAPSMAPPNLWPDCQNTACQRSCQFFTGSGNYNGLTKNFCLAQRLGRRYPSALIFSPPPIRSSRFPSAIPFCTKALSRRLAVGKCLSNNLVTYAGFCQIPFYEQFLHLSSDS